MEKHPEWVFILFTRDQKSLGMGMKGSKNWTTLVKSTNEQIQCPKHGEPNQAAS
jgi:hypothetical protein